MPMKITQLSDGNLKLVTCSPLLIHGSLDTRIVRQFDAGRLSLLTTTDKLTGSVETNARLTPLDKDPDWDRKNEARLLLEPARLLPRDSLTLTETYLGRFSVMEARVISTLGGNTMLEAHTVLAPFVMRQLEWNNHWDGQEMLELAVEAGIDDLLLSGASSACARLAMHLAARAPQPRQALEAVEAWVRGGGSVDEMERAWLENKPGRDEQLCGLHQSDRSFAHAADACSCFPGNVVANVANAHAAALADMQRHWNAIGQEVNNATLNMCQSEVGNIMRAACANIIRTIIKVEDHPSLAAVIARRNAELCRPPSCNCAQFQTEEIVAC